MEIRIKKFAKTLKNPYFVSCSSFNYYVEEFEINKDIFLKR